MLRLELTAYLLLVILSAPAPAQMTPEQQAEMLINSARRAYNERNYPFATARFREYLQKFADQKDGASARYGLAICLLEGPEKNFPEAIQNLQPLSGDKNFADHPYALYYLAHCQRALGARELTQAAAKPAEAAQRKQEAVRRFEEASRNYTAAIDAFLARIKKDEPQDKELLPETEWAARARCDLAEMQVRMGKTKEAQATAAPFQSDKLLVKSRYRRLGLYYHGFASFLLKDNLTAGRSLSQLAPFSDAVFGTHASYLLARIHHLDGERAEATQQYQNVLTRHEQQVKEAKDAIKNPAAFKDDPDERARLTALANSAPPDHYARALLYLGVLAYEDGKFGDALTRFTEFDKQMPTSPLAPEVRLRIGFCQVQQKNHAEALKVLTPLSEKPEFADQALLWMGKAQSGSADPANADAYVKAQIAAVETIRRATERAKGDTAELKSRRGQILLEMAEVQLLAKQPKEAAATLTQILQEKLIPTRAEEVTQRQASALHLAGDYTNSDAVCLKFRDTFPKSTLLPAVMFRYAENAAFAALSAEKKADLPDRENTLKKLQDEAIARYKMLVERFPEHPQVNLARFGLGMGHYRKGELDKAVELFESIPAADRAGELVVVPYVLSDCLIRLAPTETDDALSAGKLKEAMAKSIEALNSFVGAMPNAPQTTDAYLKLGYCYARLSEIQAVPAEKQQTLTAAYTAYDTIMKKYAQDALYPQAVFERARIHALRGDVGGATNELRKFTNDQRLSQSSIAPMALLRLATMLRAQNRAQEAADVLDKARQAHEANLSKDPARAGWVALLQYHHGIALKEFGKLPEARALFDSVVKNHATRPEAVEAALRYGQTLKEEGTQRVIAAKQLLAQQGRKPEQVAEDRKKLDEGVKMLDDAVKYLEARAEALKAQKPESTARARMLYDAVWATRTLADLQVETAREKLRQDKWQEKKDEVAKKTPPGQKPPFVAAPEITLAMVPQQEGEKKVRALYQALVTAFPDLEQNTDARFEFAEVLSERDEHDAAIKMLQEALDREPPAELTERIRIRLGFCMAAKGDVKGALTQFAPIAKNEKSPHRAQAAYRIGECYMLLKDYESAEKELKAFRDFGPYQNVPNVTDRALLRLGHALGQLKQWDASLQAHSRANASGGPWRYEARYGMGWAHQNKGEFDQAVAAYSQVTTGTATELGARAQLNIGLCRLAQKKYAEASTALLVVPFTYDYPELSSIALLEAARALAEDKQKEKAIGLLKRLLRDHPESESAKAAKLRLEELEKS